jgi:hypothetical protein
MKGVKKESAIFILLFLFLSFAMHFGAWMNHPLLHIESLEKSPLGVWHPLYITLLVYLFVLFLRFLLKVVRKIFI